MVTAIPYRFKSSMNQGAGDLTGENTRKLRNVCTLAAYDFIVAPRAQVEDIELAFDGVKKILYELTTMKHKIL